MTFNKFLYEEGIAGVMIGTISGLAISNLMKDVNKEVITKILKKLKMSNVGLLSSLLEFILQIIILFLLYKLVLYPIFKTEIEIERRENENKVKWRNNLLDEVKTLDVGNVYF
jgi:large-conductance mechanosensitive channel